MTSTNTFHSVNLAEYHYRSTRHVRLTNSGLKSDPAPPLGSMPGAGPRLYASRSAESPEGGPRGWSGPKHV